MRRLLLLALLSICFFSCKRKDEEPSANNVDFSSYQRFDFNANYLGTVGDATDDYKMEEWPQWVFDLFKPLDTANLTGYDVTDVSIDALYPNPCADTQVMRLSATQPTNLKVVMIDVNRNVLIRRSMHIPSAIHFVGFDYKGLNLDTAMYRMFYAFSAEDHKYFIRGHIDINKVQ